MAGVARELRRLRGGLYWRQLGVGGRGGHTLAHGAGERTRLRRWLGFELRGEALREGFVRFERPRPVPQPVQRLHETPQRRLVERGDPERQPGPPRPFTHAPMPFGPIRPLGGPAERDSLQPATLVP